MVHTEPTLVPLPDGRRLACETLGPVDGRAVFFFHGLPGSRVQRHPGTSDIADRLRVRLVTLDRPGLGASDLQSRRMFCGFAEDVARVADALGIGRFAVSGWSGGGPHALACAAVLGRRVTAVGILAGTDSFAEKYALEGMSKGNRLIFGIAKRRCLSWVGSLLWRSAARTAMGDPDAFLDRMDASAPEKDKATLADPAVREVMRADLHVAFERGHQGAAIEARLHARPWDFAPGAISAPVHLWQGDLDVNVPLRMAKRIAGRVPGSTLHERPGHGHFSLLVDGWEECQKSLAEALPA